MNLCISKRKRIIEVENESFTFFSYHTYTIAEKASFVKDYFQLSCVVSCLSSGT
jgi:hypothetical protein